jgi:hypothetical protein
MTASALTITYDFACPICSNFQLRPQIDAVSVTLLPICTVILMAGPNFNCEWKMNSSKCDFGQMPAHSSIVQKIRHEDPNLNIVITWSGVQGEMTNTFVYTTEGKECENKSAMGLMKAL